MDEYTQKTIDQIWILMHEHSQNDDFEAAHGNADYLLVELVELLKQRCTADERAKIDGILAEYEAVGKWYA